MQAWSNINAASLLDTFVSLSFAFALGSLIGLERQYRQRTAGLRTNTLVAVGAAAFVDMAARLTGAAGAVQVTAYVVSGVGFLGAGAIMKEGANVRGLNTAATLWGSAAVGACAGADLVIEATFAAIFVLASNTMLRPVVNAINRQPINEEASEITYAVYVICDRARQKDVRAQVEELLEAASYPIRDLDVHPFGQSDVEIAATLMATSVDANELDHITGRLVGEAHIRQAFWTPSATE